MAQSEDYPGAPGEPIVIPLAEIRRELRENDRRRIAGLPKTPVSGQTLNHEMTTGLEEAISHVRRARAAIGILNTLHRWHRW